MAAFTVFWFFCIGTCVGSFLNVIVWRWPRGHSLVREPSACPACQTLIRWDDNIPIIGWLRLRGRCRTCQAAISTRYPLVETLVGVQFVGLLCAEALTGGATIPVRPIDPYAGVVWIIWYAMQPDLLRLYAWHLGLLFVANIIWLIDEDGQTLPRSLLPMVVTGGLVALAAFPDLHPTLNIQLTRGEWFAIGQRWQGVLGGGVGLLAGIGVGALSAGMVRHQGFGSVTFSGVLLLGAIGLALGWQAAISTALLASVVALLRAGIERVASKSWIGSSVFDIWLALHIQLLSWRWLDRQPWWPSSQSPWFVIGLSILVIEVLRVLTDSIRKPLLIAKNVDGDPQLADEIFNPKGEPSQS